MKPNRHIHIYLHIQYERFAMNICIKKNLYIQYEHIYMIILSNFHFHHTFHIYIEMYHSNISTYSMALQIHTYKILDIDTLLCTMV